MSVRESLAQKAKIGTVEFYAQRLRTGGQRRIAIGTAIGQDGGKTIDLGEDAKHEVIQAELDEDVWLKLEGIRRARQVVTCVSPLFGVMQARVLSCPAEVNTRNMVDCTITLVEDGEHVTTLPPQTITLSAASKKAKSIFDGSLSDDLDGLADIPDAPSDVTNAATDMSSAWDSFDAVLDNVEDGLSTVDELASELGSLGGAVDTLVDSVDRAWTDVEELVDSVVVDSAMELLDAATECVQAASETVSTDIWRQVKTLTPIALTDLAEEWLGSPDDDAVDAILDANPQIIDTLYAPPGTELNIPINK